MTMYNHLVEYSNKEEEYVSYTYYKKHANKEIWSTVHSQSCGCNQKTFLIYLD